MLPLQLAPAVTPRPAPVDPADRRRGQPADRAQHGRELPGAARRASPSIAQKVDESIKSLFATGLFDDVTHRAARATSWWCTVVENPIINRIAFEGNKRLETKVLESGDPAAPARGLHPRARPERGQPHPRALPPQRPLRRQGRAQDHRARPEPRRSGVRDQRGPADRRRRHQRSSATSVQRQHAARRDPDQARAAWYRFLSQRRHLRSRSAVVRRGAAAPLLQRPRLRRLPGRLGRWPS